MKKYEASVTLSDFRRNFRKHVTESDLTNPLASMRGGDAYCGKIKDNSRDIICLPNKVRVTVTKKSAIDAVSD